jgi:long-chain-fatty-acid--CoA ligase ACSBG
VEKVKK